MAEDKILTMKEIGEAFSNLRTYSYSPAVYEDKLIKLCGLDNLDEYKKVINQKYMRFQNGDNDDIIPIEIVGKQPKAGLFGLNKKKVNRENWENFYTDIGRRMVLDIVRNNALEKFEKYIAQESAFLNDKSSGLAHFQAAGEVINTILDAMKAWETLDTVMLLQDNPFFVQDVVRWYGFHPSIVNGQVNLKQAQDQKADFYVTPVEHWTKELESQQEY